MVDDNTAAATASTNAGIEHTSTPYPMGHVPAPKITEDFIDLEPQTGEEDDREIKDVDVPALDLDEIIDVDAEEEFFKSLKLKLKLMKLKLKLNPMNPQTNLPQPHLNIQQLISW